MSGYVKAGQTFLKALMSGGKQKTTGTEVIKNIKVSPNIDTKRNIQDAVVKAVDEGTKKGLGGAPISESTKKYASKLKKDKSKQLKDYSYTADKYEKKAKGGRVGLKRGTFPDYSGDGKTTMKDILMGRGVIPKTKDKKKMMAKKSETPMDKAIKKKNKNNKRII